MLNLMLRPVPARPPGPVDPAEALAFVASALPALDASAQNAFALVVLGGKPRSSVPELSAEEVSIALARSRKQVRRAACQLSGSGWCERAERLISDRLDDCLDDSRLLDVHLENCERCVEHERRLVTAQNALVTSFVSAPPEAGASEPPALRVAPEPAAESEPAAGRDALVVLTVLFTLAAIVLAIAGALGAL